MYKVCSIYRDYSACLAGEFGAIEISVFTAQRPTNSDPVDHLVVTTTFREGEDLRTEHRIPNTTLVGVGDFIQITMQKLEKSLLGS